MDAARKWALHDVSAVCGNLLLVLCDLPANIPNWKWHVFYPYMENVYLAQEQNGQSNVSCQGPSGVDLL